MSAPKSKDGTHFVLTYKSVEDPGQDEVVEALDTLRPFAAEEVLPGTIRVCGEPQRVEAAARPMRNWTLAPEGRLGETPPHKAAIKRP